MNIGSKNELQKNNNIDEILLLVESYNGCMNPRKSGNVPFQGLSMNAMISSLGSAYGTGYHKSIDQHQ